MKKKTLDMVIFAVVALLFSLVAMLTPVFRRNSDATCSPLVFLVALLVFALAYFGLDMLIDWVRKKPLKLRHRVPDRKLRWSLFGLFCLIGLWNLLLYYPGVGMYDTLKIISTKVIYIGRQHPWFFCTIVRGILLGCQTLGFGYETALLVCSILQILVTAWVYSFVLMWLREKKVHPVIWLIAVGFYALTPILGLYMVTLLKDIPYGLLLTAWVPVLYEYWQTKGQCIQTKKYMDICILLVILSLLRNNGIYVSAFIIVAMLVVSFRQWKRLCTLLVALALVVIGSNALEDYNDITHLFRETVGIPLQQIAATVTYGGEITDEQLEFIDRVLPVEYIKEHYDPYSVDKIKLGGSPIDDDFLNENKGRFLKVWLELLPKNFGIYVEAYLKNTYGFWSLDNRDYNVKYTTIYQADWADWLVEKGVDYKNVFPQPVQQFFEAIATPLLKTLGAGSFLWIYILLLILLIRRNDWRILLIAAPSIGCWLTLMISTPVAYQWRYLFSVPITIPILFALLFVKKKKKTAPAVT